MAEVTNKMSRQSMKQMPFVPNASPDAAEGDVLLEDGISIGLDGSSGHGCCKKFCFGAYGWPTLSLEFFFGALQNILITAFRVDAGKIAPLVILWRFLVMVWTPFIGKLQDGEYLRPCFEGCQMRRDTEYQKDADGKVLRDDDGKRIVKRKGWGRRAPHLVYTTTGLVIISLFLYQPAGGWCSLAKEKDSTAKLNGKTIIGWTNDMGEESADWVAGDFPMNSAAGLDCSKPLKLNVTGDGVIEFSKIYTDSAGGETPLYSHEICTNLVSLTSVCWPGPVGAAGGEGDGAPRVCGQMNQDALSLHWFIMAILMKWFCENIYMAMNPAKFEVYPWKNERVQVTAMIVIYAVLAILVFVVANAQIQGANELGSMPNGGQGIRNGWAIYMAISCCIGFGSIPATRDAQQFAKKSTNLFQEYKQILTSKHEAHYAFRIFVLKNASHSLWNGLRIGTIVFYMMYARMVPLAQTAAVIGAGAGLGLFLNACLQGFWAAVFGQKSSKGREHGRDPRMWAFTIYVVGLIGWLLIVIGLMQPVKPGTSIGTGLGMFILMVYHEIQNSITSALNASWLGWCIDLDNHYWQIEKGEKKRREAIYRSFLSTWERLMGVLGAIFILGILLNPSLCNTALDPKDMDPKCGETMFY